MYRCGGAGVALRSLGAESSASADLIHTVGVSDLTQMAAPSSGMGGGSSSSIMGIGHKVYPVAF